MIGNEQTQAGAGRPQSGWRARNRGAQCAGHSAKDLLARLQVKGVDISLPALSLLEGQKRPVSDIELKALVEVLQVDVRWLLGMI